MSITNVENKNCNKLKDELLRIHEFLFDHAYDIILYLDENGNILNANKMAIEKYGYTFNELTSMNIKHLRHSSMDSDYINQMILSECEGLIYEGIHVRKNSELLPVEVSSKTMVLDHNNKFRIHIIRDTTERKKIESKIIHLANYDPLTNVANRSNILSQLDDSIEKSRLTGNNIAFIMLDIDKFKIINDTFGHLLGDKALKYVAQTIKKLLRSSDSIGRFGGDEFVIIQRYVKSKEDVISLIHRIFDVFKNIVILENNSINISMSMGVCLLSQAKDKDDLIHKADSAMYEAKKTKGCSFEFYNDI